MKKSYKAPMAKYVDFNYDEQVTASSVPVYCDQGWSKETTLVPWMRSTECARCYDKLIWIETTGPEL